MCDRIENSDRNLTGFGSLWSEPEPEYKPGFDPIGLIFNGFLPDFTGFGYLWSELEPEYKRWRSNWPDFYRSFQTLTHNL